MVFVVQNDENAVLDEFTDERNELNELKNELKKDTGTNTDIKEIVDLRKSEMDHAIKMERIDMEREKMLHEQSVQEKQINADRLKNRLNETEAKLERERQEKEQIGSVVEELKEENEQLHGIVEELTSEPPEIELDDDLQDLVTNHESEFAEIDGELMIIDDVENLLNDNEKIIKKISKWCKKHNIKKSEYPILNDLNDINTSLNDMFDQYDIQDAEELTFHFDTETELRLKEKYS